MTPFGLIITKLIEEDKGDLLRLRDMLVRLRTGKKLYNSDVSYLEKLNPEIKNREKIIEKPIKLFKIKKSESFFYNRNPILALLLCLGLVVGGLVFLGVIPINQILFR
jgi:hypothetical protein